MKNFDFVPGMKYIITTDNWFYAPDGIKYKAVWGSVQIFTDENLLNIKTNRNSSNWYIVVGDEDNHVIVAGYQIHYAVRCKNKPNCDETLDWSYGGNNNDINIFSRPSEIYCAEEND